MTDSNVLEILSWLSWSLADTDDLVASRTRFEALASWLSEQPVFASLEERDALSLDELLAYLADNLPGGAPEAMADQLEHAVSVISELSILARRASYDVPYLGAEPDFSAIAKESTLEELERSGILNSNVEKPR